MTNQQSSIRDTDRIHLSKQNKLFLDELVADGFFKDGLSAVRYATSYALKCKLNYQAHKISDRTENHIYLVSQVDPDGLLKNALLLLNPMDSNTPHKHLEKAADIGLAEIQQQLSKTDQLPL